MTDLAHHLEQLIEQQETDPHAEITQLLRQYFDALYTGDTQLLSRVFHPKAHYTCIQQGQLVHWDMPTYFDVVAKRTAPAEYQQARQDQILSIDFAGPQIASAKVKCALNERLCTDFLNLIKHDNQWWIINKSFHFDVQDFHSDLSPT